MTLKCKISKMAKKCFRIGYKMDNNEFVQYESNSQTYKN